MTRPRTTNMNPSNWTRGWEPIRWLRYGPRTRELCEQCGQQLRRREVREITNVELDANGMGGWSMSAIYCPTDYPGEPA